MNEDHSSVVSDSLNDWRQVMKQRTASRLDLLSTKISLDQVASDQEIEMRASLLRELWDNFRVLQDPADLFGAIDQLETILRRLPDTSPDLPGYLDDLSNMRVSQFKITNAPALLDEAVELSLRAKNEAVSMGFPDNNKDVYLKMLNGLGCSQSSRFQHLHRDHDLDDAIATGRELISIAPKDSKFYAPGLSNLTARLWNRFKTRRNDADNDEVMRLLDQLIQESQPDSPSYAAALLQRSAIMYSRSEDTGRLDDLDNAICCGEFALAEMMRHRSVETILNGNFAEIFERLPGMYADRYDKKGDLDDLLKALSLTETRIRWRPPTHPSRGPELSRYLRYAQTLADKTSEIDELESLIRTASELITTMPKGDYTRRGINNRRYGTLLTRRYTLTSELDHLLAVVENADSGPRGPGIAAISLARYLGKISRATKDNRIRKSACERLQRYFRTACQTTGIPNASVTLWNQQKHMIMVYADAIEASEDLEEDELEQRVRDKVAKARTTEESSKGKKPWAPAEYTTEFGSRALVGDATTKKSIVEMPAVVQKVFGYTDMTPLPTDQFINREIQLERQAREKGAQGRGYPNPRLCRACRKLRVLEPSSKCGWKWNSRVQFIPYGNYEQLCMRHSCAVCCLLLSLIIDNKVKGLHPRLAAIDPEIQGISIEPTHLDNGEEILRVSYGLKEVGALTILRPDTLNRYQELPIEYLKRALRECDNNHGRQCNGQALASRLASPIDMLFIDVIDECLVRATSAVKYFALSHVWGNAPMSETIKSNLASRLMKGGLRSDRDSPLPQTVTDAVALVNTLGERFLWVDALCIVQDDDLTKRQNIQQMDRVYSRAFATIIIIPGSDAASGIPGIRPGTRTPLNTETISISDRSATLELNPCSSHIEQVQITASPSPLTLAMDSSTWNTRGWTFQERLLSARCIYITHNAIYFHCHRDILLCETGQATSPATPALSLLNNPLHELQRLDGRVLVNNRIGTAGNDEALLRVVFGVYKGLVAGYSPRKLTFLGDVLNAFAGVFAVITQHLPGAVALCGLPGAFLDLALLWTPVNPLQRREEAVAGLRDLLAATDSNGRCPGWSWAGFVGPVDYRMFGEDEDKRPLPVSLVVDGFKVVHGGKVLRVAGRGVREDDEANQSVMRIGDAAGSDSVSALTDYGPNILQFKAFVVPVTAFLRGARSEYLCVLGQSHATGQQAVYRLYDQDRRHCGLCYEPMVPLGDIARAGQSSFIGIVRHGETDIPFKGPNRVEGDIPLFDRSAYKACGPGSGVVDALLVVWDKDQRDCIARRVSVARIHVKAWERAGPVSKNIALC